MFKRDTNKYAHPAQPWDAHLNKTAHRARLPPKMNFQGHQILDLLRKAAVSGLDFDCRYFPFRFFTCLYFSDLYFHVLFYFYDLYCSLWSFLTLIDVFLIFLCFLIFWSFFFFSFLWWVWNLRKSEVQLNFLRLGPGIVCRNTAKVKSNSSLNRAIHREFYIRYKAVLRTVCICPMYGCSCALLYRNWVFVKAINVLFTQGKPVEVRCGEPKSATMCQQTFEKVAALRWIF